MPGMVPTKHVAIRITDEDKARWKAAADKAGLTLTAAIEQAMSDWCRKVERRST